jgi:hypothetical protein
MNSSSFFALSGGYGLAEVRRADIPTHPQTHRNRAIQYTYPPKAP